MITTVDSAGRIVVPKLLRQALNIKPGQTLEIRAGDGRLEIEITATPMTLKKRGKDVVAVPVIGLSTLTAEAVRETLEHIRRRKWRIAAWSSLCSPRGTNTITERAKL